MYCRTLYHGMTAFGFDVIIPTYYTKPQHIQNAVQSVFNQSHDNWHIYISDGTPVEEEERSIENALKDFDNSRITILRQEGKGISNARNQATKAGSKEYIALLDSDDLWYDNKLELYVEELKKNPQLNFIWGKVKVPIKLKTAKGNLFESHWDGGNHAEWWITRPEHRAFRVLWNPLMTSTHVYSRRAWEATNGWDEQMTLGEDTDLNIRIIEIDPAQCLQITETVGEYGVHPEQTTKGGASHKEESGIKPMYRTQSFIDAFTQLKQKTEQDKDSQVYWQWLYNVVEAERMAYEGEGNDTKSIFHQGKTVTQHYADEGRFRSVNE